MRKKETLRRRLMVMTAVSVAALWLLIAPWLLLGVRSQVQNSLDDRLAASARMVASLISQQQLTATADGEVVEPAVASPHFPLNLACRISSLQGEVIALSENAPGDVLGGDGNGYSTREADGERWRVYTLTTDTLKVSTADRLSTRDSLMTSILLAAVLPFAIALAGTLALIWFDIRRGFRPLEKLSSSVAARDLDDPTPLAWEGSPGEVKPLVDEINRLLLRAQEALQRERRFTGDAAHELRTPLTAIKTQLQVARLTKEQQSRRALEQAERAVDRLQATLDQLLLLARLEGDAAFGAGDESTVGRIMRMATADVQHKAHDRNLEFRFRESCDRRVAVPAALAVTAIRNILENAVRVSPEGSPIEIHTACESDFAVWTVRDHGPGVPEEKLPELSRRFVHFSGQGSGLGLAIVSTVAERFGGNIEVANATPSGLQVRLRLPLAQGKLNG